MQSDQSYIQPDPDDSVDIIFQNLQGATIVDQDKSFDNSKVLIKSPSNIVTIIEEDFVGENVRDS